MPGAPIQLTQYGMTAEKHWREFLPRMISDLERQRKLRAMLLEAEEKTKEEMHEQADTPVRAPGVKSAESLNPATTRADLPGLTL